MMPSCARHRPRETTYTWSEIRYIDRAGKRRPHTRHDTPATALRCAALETKAYAVSLGGNRRRNSSSRRSADVGGSSRTEGGARVHAGTEGAPYEAQKRAADMSQRTRAMAGCYHGRSLVSGRFVFVDQVFPFHSLAVLRRFALRGKPVRMCALCGASVETRTCFERGGDAFAGVRQSLCTRCFLDWRSRRWGQTVRVGWRCAGRTLR